MLSTQADVLRILIADDHDLTRFTLKIALQRQANLELVGVASDGQQAVEMAKASHPDVVILDMQMPVMDGALASRQIKKTNPDIAIIGYSSLQTNDCQNLLKMARLDAVCDKCTSTLELVNLAWQLSHHGTKSS